jgi:hypothetical protein
MKITLSETSILASEVTQWHVRPQIVADVGSYRFSISFLCNILRKCGKNTGTDTTEQACRPTKRLCYAF